MPRKNIANKPIICQLNHLIKTNLLFKSEHETNINDGHEIYAKPQSSTSVFRRRISIEKWSDIEDDCFDLE
jgi:hypothetical protein